MPLTGMQPILQNKLADVIRILKENQVKQAYAFGSVCTDEFTDASDIDILISFDDSIDPVTYGENYFVIAHALEETLNRPVDLVTERSIKNPYFLAMVNRTKTPIYE